MKSAVVAKLVHQASDFYADAMKLLQLGSIREIWPKVKTNTVHTEWLREMNQVFTNVFVVLLTKLNVAFLRIKKHFRLNDLWLGSIRDLAAIVTK